MMSRSYLLLALIALLLVAPSIAGKGSKSSKNKKNSKKKYQKKYYKKKNSNKCRKRHDNVFKHINYDYEDLTAAELLLAISSDEGFDDNQNDYDILLELVGLAGLTDALNGELEDFTVFPPNDKAFCHTARKDLGYKGSCNDEDVFKFYAGFVTDLVGEDELVNTIANILLYHVSPKEQTVHSLREEREFDTLLEITVDVRKARNQGCKRTVLKDESIRYPKIDYKLQNIKVDGGLVHSIQGVLLPF